MILGVNGGIGSGKTTVCKVFNVLGIPVFMTDNEAKILMNSNQDIREELNSVIGKDLYQTGTLDRETLASIIFTNKSMLERVNELIHPLVFEQFQIWVDLQDSQYVIMESAILFESGASRLVNKIASVIAPLKERIERVSQRNNLTIKQIRERIENQITDEVRISLSDYIIYNSDKDMIIPAIINIHNDIIESIKKDNL